MARDKPTWESASQTLETREVQAPDEQTTRSGASVLPERYEDLGQIGRGGNGEVRRVYDTVLERDLAMKLLLPGRSWSAERIERLRAEAIVTAQLQHPGIVPVHDCGQLPDGRVWFTMKEIRGITLGQAIKQAHDPGGEWTLRSLLARYVQVCQAVAFAHSRRVVHRDLKPNNIMVGEFGEVLVVDWGLAMSVGPEDAGRMRIEGTPVYMAPEQAKGCPGAARPPVDAYALGAVLYEILSGRAPYRVAGRAALRAVLDGPPRALGEGTSAPAELIALCQEAMARQPEARVTAREILAGVQGWLDGERKREEALAVVAQADALRPQLLARHQEAADLRAQAEALLADVSPSDPLSAKEPAWALQDTAAEQERQARLSETVWLQTLRSALNRVPELPEAHARLADHYRQELTDAEARRDTDAAASCAWLLRQHDRGRHRAFLTGTGTVSLTTDPPGAEVRLHRYVEQKRRLIAQPLGVLGTTPLHRAPLDPGSYLLTLHHPDRAVVRYPILIERQGHWEGEVAIHLPRPGELREDECYVPAGRFLAGGDPNAGDSLERQWVWVDGFVIQRHPVTNAQYLAFLNDLVAQGRAEEAERWQPLSGSSAVDVASALPVYRRESGLFVLGSDSEGVAWKADWPVTQIDWFCAQAYADWASQGSTHLRLANELEREKSARGVDGRFYPWGDDFDEGFARIGRSVTGPPRPASIDEYPIDKSVYGVCGLSGNTRDWCHNRWTQSGPIEATTQSLAINFYTPESTDYMSTRGGAYIGLPSSSRAAARFGNQPRDRMRNVGVRLTRNASSD